MRSASAVCDAGDTTTALAAGADPRLGRSATGTDTLLPAPASTGVLVTVLVAELVSTAAIIASSTGHPTPTIDDLGTAAYLAGLGIAATSVGARATAARGPTTRPPGADLSPVWTLPAALLLHPALTAALVVVLHSFQFRHIPRTDGSPRRQLIGVAAAVLACLAARAAYTLAGGHLADAPATAAGSHIGSVVVAVLCHVVIHPAVLTATGIPNPTGRDENQLAVATSSLGGLTATALAIHPLLVVFVLPAACCLDRAVLARHLEHAGRLDLKTGLLNAAAWHHQAQQGLLRRDPADRPWAVLVIDLDDFKAVNDTHGHLAGDAVLVAVADALRAEVRDRDLVGRFGGDEFVVLLERHDRPGTAALLAVAERIRGRVAALHVDAPTPHGATIVTGLGVSIGAAPLAENRPDLQASFHLADTALYDAKRAGRGGVRIATDPPPTKADEDPDTAVTRRSRA